MPGSRASEDVRRQQIVDAAFELASKGGIGAITVRDVAQKCGISTGLVLFHFESKDRLVLALLDWVVASTVSLTIDEQTVEIADPLERLASVLGSEIDRVSREPQRNRLFFEFWNQGLSNRAIRSRMQRDLDNYREAFLPLIDALLDGYPSRFRDTNAAALSTAIVSLIKGCALQSMIEPHLDVDALIAAATGLLGVTMSPSPSHRI
jgi:TetR/AcrR family transcriptional repressor of bet genes